MSQTVLKFAKTPKTAIKIHTVFMKSHFSLNDQD